MRVRHAPSFLVLGASSSPIVGNWSLPSAVETPSSWRPSSSAMTMLQSLRSRRAPAASASTPSVFPAAWLLSARSLHELRRRQQSRHRWLFFPTRPRPLVSRRVAASSSALRRPTSCSSSSRRRSSGPSAVTVPPAQHSSDLRLSYAPPIQTSRITSSPTASTCRRPQSAHQLGGAADAGGGKVPGGESATLPCGPSLCTPSIHLGAPSHPGTASAQEGWSGPAIKRSSLRQHASLGRDRGCVRRGCERRLSLG